MNKFFLKIRIKEKRTMFSLIFLLLVMFVTYGSSIFTKILNMSGITRITCDWNIRFDNIILNDNSDINNDSNKDAKILDSDNEKIEFSTRLSNLNDFYEFNVYTVNDGCYDAMVESIIKDGLDGKEEYVSFDVRYDDLSISDSDEYYSNKYIDKYSNDEVKPCDPLFALTRRKIKVRVQLKKELENIDYIDLNLGFKINYIPLDEENCSINKHKLTINPNGGMYDGSRATTVKNIGTGGVETIKVPKKGDQSFLGWDVTPNSGSYIFDASLTSEQQFTMGDEDVTITARWGNEGDYVARIMDTYYTTIQAAFEAVDDGWQDNTVFLLKDTTEYPTNGAYDSFVFDLGGYTVTGVITNSVNSDITLINGVVQADTGDQNAIYNFGKLSLGIDDGTVEGENRISIKGNNVGIVNAKDDKDNTNEIEPVFNFYDGYVEAKGEGYVNPIIGNITNYPNNYSVITSKIEGGLRAILDPDPSRKIVKTTTNGAIFYANIEDAFNAAIGAKKYYYENQKRKVMEQLQNSGQEFDEEQFKNSYLENFEENNGLKYEDFYKVYAVRSFEIKYVVKIGVENDENIVDVNDIYFDTNTFDIAFSDEIINNGELHILSSKTYTNADNRSVITLKSPIKNKNKLFINDINMQNLSDCIPDSGADSSCSLIINENELVINDAKLNSIKGNTIYNIENGTIDLNKNVVIKADDRYSIYNNSNKKLELDDGTIYGVYNSTNLKISGDVILLAHRGSDNTEFRSLVNNSNVYDKKSVVNIEGGNIRSEIDTIPIYNEGDMYYSEGIIASDNVLILNDEKFIMNDGELSSNNTIIIGGNVEINKGTLTSNNDTIVGSNLTINSGLIESVNENAILDSNVIMKGGYVKAKKIGIYEDFNIGYITIENGTIEAGNIGIQSNCGYQNTTEINMSGGKILATNIGLYNTYSLNLTGGEIIAHNPDNQNSTSIGVHIAYNYHNSFNVNITGGKISGDLYGIQNGGKLTIGNDDYDEQNKALINIESPIITGGLYGLYTKYVNSQGYVYFYDGILKGTTYGYHGLIDKIPLKSNISESDESIYKTNYVENQADWIKVGNQKFNNIDDASKAIDSFGTIEMIRNADISFNQEFINNDEGNKKIIFDFNGYKLTTTQPITNNVELEIKDSSTSKSASYEPLSNMGFVNNNTMTIYGGTYQGQIEKTIYNKNNLIIENATFNVGENAIYNSGNLTIENIEINSNKYGIINSENITFKNGHIKSNSNCINLVEGGGQITIKNGTLESDYTAIYQDRVQYGYEITIDGGKISGDNGNAINTGSGDIIINGGEIISNNATAIFDVVSNLTVNDGKIRGINGIKCNDTDHSPNITINGGTITGFGTNGEKVGNGIFMVKGLLQVSGGKVIGEKNGITATNFVQIGTDDYENGEAYILQTPIIQGKNYALSNNSYTNFFDGVLKGGLDAHTGLITLIPNGTMIGNGSENIDDFTYKTEYITEFGKWLKVGNQEFSSINDAVKVMNDGDKMIVIADAYIGFNQEIPIDKNIELDLHGHSLIMTEPLKNYGTLKITDETATSDNFGGSINNNNNSAIINSGNLTIEGGYYTSQQTLSNNVNIYTINNNEGATITFENGSIISDNNNDNYALYNSGTFNMNGGKIDTINEVYNLGVFKMTNGYIKSQRESSIITKGKSTISGGTIENEKSYNSKTIYVKDGGILEVSGGKINSSNGTAIHYEDNENTGYINISGGEIFGKENGIYFNGNSFYSISTNSEITGGLIKSDQYGVFVYDGIINVTGGTIDSELVGVLIYGGTLVLGENEDNSAIINNSSPRIIGESYAVYNGHDNHTGLFEFYDGLLLKNSNSGVDIYGGDITKIPNRTELFFDTEVIDGINYNSVYLTLETKKATAVPS